MEDMKVRKLRDKLGISAEAHAEAAGSGISPNVRKDIPAEAEPGGNFISAPGSGGNFVSAPGAGGNFASAIGGRP